MQVGLRTIHPTATRANRFVLWVWHSRVLLGREDLLARHRVPMRWPARLAFLADVRGVSSRSPFVPWRAAAAEAVATVATLDALIRQSRNRRSGTARLVRRSSALPMAENVRWVAIDFSRASARAAGHLPLPQTARARSRGVAALQAAVPQSAQAQPRHALASAHVASPTEPRDPR
jgi:hypothetical protein